MNCSEFHDLLADVCDDLWPEEMSRHLHTCARCDELVADIRYIACQAQVLMPLLEPSPRVWQRIGTKLRRGLKQAEYPEEA